MVDTLTVLMYFKLRVPNFVSSCVEKTVELRPISRMDAQTEIHSKLKLLSSWFVVLSAAMFCCSFLSPNLVQILSGQHLFLYTWIFPLCFCLNSNFCAGGDRAHVRIACHYLPVTKVVTLSLVELWVSFEFHRRDVSCYKVIVPLSLYYHFPTRACE